MYEKLFQPGKIGNVTVKNRLVMSPMGVSLANMDGTPGDQMIAYYEARAIGGAGLIIPEICRVDDKTGAGELRQISISQDYHIPGMARLAAAIHQHGTKMFLQLHHPGREGVSALIGGQPVVSASAIMCKVSQQETRALETEEVEEIIQEFIQGAVRAKKAGVDGVELHAAHGYLLQQFISPYTNKRTDKYGGSFENRLRMITEIIQGIRKECGADYPLGVRLTVEEFLDKTGVTEDYIHIQDGVKIAMYLDSLGVDFIDVSVGLYETGSTCVEPISFPQGWRKDLIAAVKGHVKCPVIAVSAIREPDVAESFLDEGVVDFVSLGRAWLADENWGVKVHDGRIKELRRCISCHHCFRSLEENDLVCMPLECAVNPRTAYEKDYGELKYDTDHHTVVVVGGGPSGMCAAETLALRGMKVTLLEKDDELGGHVNLAKLPPLKDRMQWLTEYYENAFERLGVTVKTGVSADIDTVLSYEPDAVICATGTNDVIPDSISGIRGENVLTIREAMTGGVKYEGKNVVVAGAGMTGIEVAEFAADKGAHVTTVDMLDTVAPEGDKTLVLDVMGRLRKYGAEFLLGHKIKEIKDGGVVTEAVADGKEETVPADLVILSLGNSPERTLAEELEKKGVKVCITGSAIKDGTIAPATRSAYNAARKLFVEEEQTSYHLSPEKVALFGHNGDMINQEGIYMAYVTDPAAVREILPPPLTPFALPIVTVSINHINNPGFADDYYETILGVYAMYGKQPGLYCVSLLLGGNGAEMATAVGRDNASIMKKVGAEFVIRRNGNHVEAGVTRRGTQVIDLKMELGRYNSYLTDSVFMSPAPGKKVPGLGFYFHFDRVPDEEGGTHFCNGMLTGAFCEYDYKAWEPGVVDLKLKSSLDDPFASLPVNSVLGGAYCRNDLYIRSMRKLQDVNADDIVPYLLTAYYDQTTWGKTGRI